MALPGSGVVNRGLQVSGGLMFNTADAFAVVQSMAVDDSATNWEAAHTAMNGAGGTARTITNSAVKNFTATPTRAAQTITMSITLSTSEGNFVIKGISIHNLTSGSVTTSSTSLIGGIANQSISKSSSFSLQITLTDLFTDNS